MRSLSDKLVGPQTGSADLEKLPRLQERPFLERRDVAALRRAGA